MRFVGGWGYMKGRKMKILPFPTLVSESVGPELPVSSGIKKCNMPLGNRLALNITYSLKDEFARQKRGF